MISLKTTTLSARSAWAEQRQNRAISSRFIRGRDVRVYHQPNIQVETQRCLRVRNLRGEMRLDGACGNRKARADNGYPPEWGVLRESLSRLLEEFHSGFGPGANVQLAVDGLQIAANSFGTEPQRVGDFLVGISARRIFENVGFALREVFGWLLRRPLALKGLHNLARNVARHGGATAMH